MTYKTISKWLLIILFIAGAATCVFGFVNGWPENKQWDDDHDVVKTLPATIQALKDAGTETLSEAELEAKKPEIEQIRAKALAASTRLQEIDDLVKAAKSDAAKKRIRNTHKAEVDTLSAQAHECNSVISAYNNAKDLNKYEAQLAEAQERIEKGNASVNTILYGAYGMMGIVFLVLFIAFVYNWVKTPMSFVKFIIVIAGAALIVFVVSKLAPVATEAEAASYGIEGLTTGDIRLTDIMLYLAYLMVGVTGVALVTSWIVSATRK